MRRGGIGVGVAVGIAVAGPVRASPADAVNQSREAALVDELEPTGRPGMRLAWRAEALAGATATGAADPSAGVLGSVSGELALAAPDCHRIAVGGQVAVRSADARLAIQQWVSACPFADHERLAFDHRFEWDVAAPLLATPRLGPGLRRRETVGLELGGGAGYLEKTGSQRWWARAPWARAEAQIGWGESGRAEEVEVQLVGNIGTVRREYGDGRPDFVMSFLGFAASNSVPLWLDERPGVTSLYGDLASFSGLPLGGFRLGGRTGGRLVDLTHVRGTGFKSVLTLVGEGAASLERDVAAGMTLRIAAERQGWSTRDGQFAIDDRATLSLDIARARLRTGIGLTAAAVHVLDIDAGRTTSGVGGLFSDVELEVREHVIVKARLEGGRSMHVAGGALDAPVWAAEATVMIGLRAGE
jgi:hypothetical protein